MLPAGLSDTATSGPIGHIRPSVTCIKGVDRLRHSFIGYGLRSGRAVRGVMRQSSDMLEMWLEQL